MIAMLFQAQPFKRTFFTTKAQRPKAPGVLWCLGVLAVIGFALSGCGGGSREGSQPVSGKVTFQGKPVSAGTIRFSNPQAAIDMTADLRPDGTYEVITDRGAGLPEGTYQVAIMPPRIDIPVGIGRLPKAPECRDIPTKYRQPSTSGLTLTVKPDVKSFDVDMKP